MQWQDPDHPTGVATDAVITHKSGTPRTVVRARNRKANAAVQLRLAGADWDEIAAALGYPTPRAALIAVEKSLERQLETEGDRTTMRRLAGARLDRLLRSVWTKAINPEHPEHLLAVTKAREIVDRHAKLYGLDAPSEVIVHTPTASELEAWVTRVVSVADYGVQEYDIIEGEVLPDEDEAS